MHHPEVPPFRSAMPGFFEQLPCGGIADVLTGFLIPAIVRAIGTVNLLDGAGLHIYDRQILADAFAVESPRYAIGLAHFPHRWSGGAAGEPADSTATRVHV